MLCLDCKAKRREIQKLGGKRRRKEKEETKEDELRKKKKGGRGEEERDIWSIVVFVLFLTLSSGISNTQPKRVAYLSQLASNRQYLIVLFLCLRNLDSERIEWQRSKE